MIFPQSRWFSGWFFFTSSIWVVRRRIMTWRPDRLCPDACRRRRPPVALNLPILLTKYVTTWFTCETRTADRDLPNTGGEGGRTLQIWLQVGAQRFRRFPERNLLLRDQHLEFTPVKWSDWIDVGKADALGPITELNEIYAVVLWLPAEGLRAVVLPWQSPLTSRRKDWSLKTRLSHSYFQRNWTLLSWINWVRSVASCCSNSELQTLLQQNGRRPKRPQAGFLPHLLTTGPDCGGDFGLLWQTHTHSGHYAKIHLCDCITP